MAEIEPPQRLTPERPPRLRRIAQVIDEQAPASQSPDHARALARLIRQRATELEMGEHGFTEDVEKEIRALGCE